jgi:glycine/D-amino acid oxidase-like deaminating enzyme
MSNGVAIHERAAFASLVESGSRIAGVRDASGREWRGDLVLLAAGAWTPFLLPHLRGVMKVTGQPVVHYRPADAHEFRAPAFPVWAADIGRSGWYGFPANADGIVKVANHGAGRVIEDPSQPRRVTDVEIARFADFLAESFPKLAAAPVVATRQCWYCDSLDGHFWIDHDPERPGLLVATGDSGHAFKFAPVLGGLIADIAERKPNPWADRFRERMQPGGGADYARGGSMRSNRKRTS